MDGGVWRRWGCGRARRAAPTGDEAGSVRRGADGGDGDGGYGDPWPALERGGRRKGVRAAFWEIGGGGVRGGTGGDGVVRACRTEKWARASDGEGAVAGQRGGWRAVDAVDGHSA